MMSMGEDRSRNVALLVGRLLLAASFAPQALAHAGNISGLAFSLAQKGLPYTDALSAMIVLVEVFCPLALMLGIVPRLAPAMLFAVTLLMCATLHRFWQFGGAARQIEQSIFTAQLGILAGLLFAFVAGPGAWSLQRLRMGLPAASKSASAKKKAPRPRTTKPKPAPARAMRDEDEFADAA
jgi:putative oxidoreductase